MENEISDAVQLAADSGMNVVHRTPEPIAVHLERAELDRKVSGQLHQQTLRLFHYWTEFLAYFGPALQVDPSVIWIFSAKRPRVLPGWPGSARTPKGASTSAALGGPCRPTGLPGR